MKRTNVLAALLSLALAAPALAQDSPKSPPTAPGIEREGPTRNPHAQLGMSGRVYVGDLAPDFELDGSRGVSVRLSRLRGDWLLLVFSDRRDQFVSVRGIEPDLRARTLDNYAARDSVPLMLADVTGEVSTMFGLFDTLHQRTVPGFLVLDRAGVVRIAFSGQSLPPDEIARLTQFAVTGL